MCRLVWFVMLLAVAAGLSGSVTPALAQTGTQSGVRGDPSRCPPPFPGAKNWSCPTTNQRVTPPPPANPSVVTGTPQIPPECRTQLNPVQLYRNPDFLDRLVDCVLGTQPAQAATTDDCGVTDGTMRLGAMLDGYPPDEAPNPPGNPRLNPYWGTWYSSWYLVLEDCIYKKSREQNFSDWLASAGYRRDYASAKLCVNITYEVSNDKKVEASWQYQFPRPNGPRGSMNIYTDFVMKLFPHLSDKAPDFPSETKAKKVRRTVLVAINTPREEITPILLQGTDKIAYYLCPGQPLLRQLEPQLLY